VAVPQQDKTSIRKTLIARRINPGV